MAINFAAANAIGLNNPGTEIITLVKDGSGNFINPPSYDKMRAYLSSGEVPMLFVTAEGGETGSLYQLADYSETENKIRFSNSANAIEFCAGAPAPVVSDVVPKPLTYDYMPEGYPKKTVQTTVLMEEQAVAFSDMGEIYGAVLTDALSLVEGQTYIVSWDGTEYECVCRNNGVLYIGNPSITGTGEDSGEPFVYVSSMKTFASLDTSPSHTISVVSITKTVIPIADEFIANARIPVLEVDGNISTTASASGHYSFLNMTFGEVYAAVNKGLIVVRQSSGGNVYVPFRAMIDNGNVILDIIAINGRELLYLELLCGNGNAYFSRNDIKKITTSDI